MRALALVLPLVVLTALAPAVTAQETEPAPCEIRGHLTIPDVHVVSERGVLSVVTIEDRDVRLTPIRRRLYEVHTEGEGAAIVGRAEQAMPILLAAERTFGSVVTVIAGTPVDDLEPLRGVLHGTVPIDAGVSLHRVELACRDLTASAPAETVLDVARGLPGPRWRARTNRLRVRGAPSEDVASIALTLEPDAGTRVAWIERERRAGWVRVQALLARARVDGWVRDSDLRHP